MKMPTAVVRHHRAATAAWKSGDASTIASYPSAGHRDGLAVGSFTTSENRLPFVTNGFNSTISPPTFSAVSRPPAAAPPPPPPSSRDGTMVTLSSSMLASSSSLSAPPSGAGERTKRFPNLGPTRQDTELYFNGRRSAKHRIRAAVTRSADRIVPARPDRTSEPSFDPARTSQRNDSRVIDLRRDAGQDSNSGQGRNAWETPRVTALPPATAEHKSGSQSSSSSSLAPTQPSSSVTTSLPVFERLDVSAREERTNGFANDSPWVDKSSDSPGLNTNSLPSFKRSHSSHYSSFQSSMQPTLKRIVNSGKSSIGGGEESGGGGGGRRGGSSQRRLKDRAASGGSTSSKKLEIPIKFLSQSGQVRSSELTHRVEKQTSSGRKEGGSGQKSGPKTLEPSKYGFHRRSKSPTFKRLVDVVEQLQALSTKLEDSQTCPKCQMCRSQTVKEVGCGGGGAVFRLPAVASANDDKGAQRRVVGEKGCGCGVEPLGGAVVGGDKDDAQQVPWAIHTESNNVYSNHGSNYTRRRKNPNQAWIRRSHDSREQQRQNRHTSPDSMHHKHHCSHSHHAQSAVRSKGRQQPHQKDQSTNTGPGREDENGAGSAAAVAELANGMGSWDVDNTSEDSGMDILRQAGSHVAQSPHTTKTPAAADDDNSNDDNDVKDSGRRDVIFPSPLHHAPSQLHLFLPRLSVGVDVDDDDENDSLSSSFARRMPSPETGYEQELFLTDRQNDYAGRLAGSDNNRAVPTLSGLPSSFVGSGGKEDGKGSSNHSKSSSHHNHHHHHPHHHHHSNNHHHHHPHTSQRPPHHPNHSHTSNHNQLLPQSSEGRGERATGRSMQSKRFNSPVRAAGGARRDRTPSKRKSASDNGSEGSSFGFYEPYEPFIKGEKERMRLEAMPTLVSLDQESVT